MHLIAVTQIAHDTPGRLYCECTHAGDDRFHRQELYGNLSIETPRHWAEVEAGYMGGACPEQLRIFLRSISDIGQPRAALAVRTELERFGVELK